jgi:hypothetical protein
MQVNQNALAIVVRANKIIDSRAHVMKHVYNEHCITSSSEYNVTRLRDKKHDTNLKKEYKGFFKLYLIITQQTISPCR